MSNENDVAPNPKQNTARKVMLITVIAIAVALGWRWWQGNHYVTTDNAQLEGHIVPMATRVSGYVKQVSINDNDVVKPGDLLVKIDDADYIARLQQAEAELAIATANAGKGGKNALAGQAEAQIGSAAASASAARSGINQAEANLQKARSDLERIRALAAQSMASAQQLEAAEILVRTEEAQVRTSRDAADAAGQQVTVYSAALRQAKSKVDSARAMRDLAAIQLHDTNLIAPAGGIISKKSVEVGQLVAPGQALFSLVLSDDVWVVANLKETDVGKVKLGDKAELEVDAYPGVKITGTVESISAATGAKFSLLPADNATGNFTKVVQRVPVKIRLDKATDKRPPLRPGMSVFATIILS